MTRDEIAKAHAEMLGYTLDSEAEYKAAGASKYEMISARSLLVKLGYTDTQADEVLNALAVGGFNYCLDPIVPGPNGMRPPYTSCVWGIDQLRSRLESVWLR